MKGKFIIRRAILTILIIVGMVLVWRGVWEVSEEFFDARTSLLIGFILLGLVAYTSRKFFFEHI